MGWSVISDCQSISATATGLPARLSFTFSNNYVNIFGTTTAGSSGTYNYAVVLQNTSATTSHTLSGIITILADTTAPVITLVGSSTINLTVGDTFTDSGATATDVLYEGVDGNITSSITTSGSVDTSTAGTYTISYNVSDAAGNAATVVQRTVIVSATAAYTITPVITLTGSSTINLTVGDTFTDAGATASDNVDGDVTSSRSIPGSVDTSTAGIYTISYNVSDAAGNAATEVYRTVIVSAATNTYSISVTASSNSDYTLSGTDRNGTVSGDDASITINSGDTLNFSVNAASHPFYIKTAQGTGTGNQVSNVTNNGAANGVVSWTPTAAGTYYYQCSAHNGMYGTITVQ